MAYKFDKELAPVFSAQVLLENTHKTPKKGVLKSVFNKRNMFVAMQFMATTSLAVSGFLSGNDGRMVTGVGNSVKNGGWFAVNHYAGQMGEHPLGHDISATRANFGGAVVSAATNAPQLVMNLGPVFAGAAAGAAWGDIIGAAMGVVAYTLMATDQFIEQKRLKHLESLGHKHYPEYPEIWNGYDEEKRGFQVGHKERGQHLHSFVFDKLPSMLLVTRGLSFVGAGIAAATGGLSIPAVLMIGAGGLFTYGALSEYKRQNYDGHHKSELVTAEDLVDIISNDNNEEDQENTCEESGEGRCNENRDDMDDMNVEITGVCKGQHKPVPHAPKSEDYRSIRLG